MDDFTLREPAPDVVLNLMAAYEPVIDGDITIRDPDGAGIRIEYDTRGLTAEVETIEIDDDRLVREWGHRLYRVLLRAKGSVRSEAWTLRARRV